MAKNYRAYTENVETSKEITFQDSKAAEEKKNCCKLFRLKN